jgi:hypothetical protein
MRTTLGIIAALAALFLSAVASADANRLAEAEEAYNRGIALRGEDPAAARREFDRAATLLRDVIASGADNAAIHFNLGNALIQSGDRGRGIAAFLRAQRLDPRLPGLAENLAHARSDVRPRLGGMRSDGAADAVAWWRVLSERSRFVAAAVAWLVGWGLVGVGVAGVRLGRPWPALRIALLVIGLVLGATIVVDRVIDARRPLAVVIADESILRKGNGDGFDPQIAEPLGSGVEVLIREERPGWLRVRLADGTEGWLRAEDVERVAG